MRGGGIIADLIVRFRSGTTECVALAYTDDPAFQLFFDDCFEFREAGVSLHTGLELYPWGQALIRQRNTISSGGYSDEWYEAFQGAYVVGADGHFRLASPDYDYGCTGVIESPTSIFVDQFGDRGLHCT